MPLAKHKSVEAETKSENLAYEELKTMTIQKKSLLSSLNTTKKAIVASNSAEQNPKVAGPKVGRMVGARLARPTVGRVAVAKVKL